MSSGSARSSAATARVRTVSAATGVGAGAGVGGAGAAGFFAIIVTESTINAAVPSSAAPPNTTTFLTTRLPGSTSLGSGSRSSRADSVRTAAAASATLPGAVP